MADDAFYIAPSALYLKKKMVIGLLSLRFHIPESRSLKGKRKVLLSLKTRIRQRFNVSVSEVDDQDKWQAATLAVAGVGTDQPGVNRMLDKVVELVRREPEMEIVESRLEFF